jgi:hypothetical protein
MFLLYIYIYIYTRCWRKVVFLHHDNSFKLAVGNVKISFLYKKNFQLNKYYVVKYFALKIIA